MAADAGAPVWFEHDGLRFHARDSGPPGAPAVLLLHGFPGGTETWERTGLALRRSGGTELRTIALRQRGYGPEARPSGVRSYRLRMLTDDALALADHLGLERFHVVGHDWGGMVGWSLAATRPARVASLTVLSTPHPRAFASALARSAQAVRSLYAAAFQLPLIPEAALTAGGGRPLRAALVRSGLDEEMADRYVARIGTADAMGAALNWYRAVARRPSDAWTVGPIDVPTTYAWSTDDPAISRRAAELTARHVVGPYRFHVLDGVSHWIPETAPAETAALVREAVDRGDAR